MYSAKNSLHAEIKPTEVVRQASVMANANTTIPKNPYRYFADAARMAPQREFSSERSTARPFSKIKMVGVPVAAVCWVTLPDWALP